MDLEDDTIYEDDIFNNQDKYYLRAKLNPLKIKSPVSKKHIKPKN